MSLSDDKTDKILEMVEALLGPGSGFDDTDEKVSLPYELLVFPEEMGNHGWFLDPVSKRMVRLPNNSEVVRITDADSDGKVIIKYPDGYALVPQEYVIEIGFN